ncbi:MAG TPA: hypothetical protein VJZ71_20480 [Phycisphaerae bacterium]|nr:hypothetical protein [Phycisphaerae bacterium]
MIVQTSPYDSNIPPADRKPLPIPEQQRNFESVVRRDRRRRARQDARVMARLWRAGRNDARLLGIIQDPKTGELVNDPAVAEYYGRPTLEQIAEASHEAAAVTNLAVMTFQAFPPRAMARMCRANRFVEQSLFTLPGLIEWFKLASPDERRLALNRVLPERRTLTSLVRSIIRARKKKERSEQHRG